MKHFFLVYLFIDSHPQTHPRSKIQILMTMALSFPTTYMCHRCHGFFPKQELRLTTQPFTVLDSDECFNTITKSKTIEVCRTCASKNENFGAEPTPMAITAPYIDSLATPCLTMSTPNVGGSPFLGSFPQETGDSTPVVVDGKIVGTRDTVFGSENSPLGPKKAAAASTAFESKLWRNSLYRKRVVRKSEFKKLHAETFPALTQDEMIFVYYAIDTNYALDKGGLPAEKMVYAQKQLETL